MFVNKCLNINIEQNQDQFFVTGQKEDPDLRLYETQVETGK